MVRLPPLRSQIVTVSSALYEAPPSCLPVHRLAGKCADCIGCTEGGLGRSCAGVRLGGSASDLLGYFRELRMRSSDPEPIAAIFTGTFPLIRTFTYREKVPYFNGLSVILRTVGNTAHDS